MDPLDGAHAVGKPQRPFTWLQRIGHGLLFLWVTLPSILVGLTLRVLTGRQYPQVLVTDPAKTGSILVVFVDNLGDILLSAGFLRDLRGNYPDSHITLVVSQDFLAAASSCPYVNKVIGINVGGSAAWRALVGPVRAWSFAKRHLWRRKFDLVLSPRWDVDSRHGTLLGLYSLGSQHIGFSSKATNARRRVINLGLDKALSHVCRGADLRHDAERGGELLEFIGISPGPPRCEIWISPEDEQFGAEELMNVAAPLIALGVGASQPKRQWPVQRFLEVSKMLIREHPNAHFLVVGNKQDRTLGEELGASLGDRLLNYAGRCSFQKSAAIMKHCDLYVGADSGPMHMAAAVGVPVVDISCHPVTGAPDHANSPLRYHPIGVPYIVLQPEDFTGPCSYACGAADAHCILSVTTDEVFQAAMKLLDEARAADRTIPGI